MPSALTFPGVYIEEIPSGVRTITGVATSITAFIGRALRGPADEPVVISSYGDFERIFGGLWVESSLGYAVRDFYLNGGSQAIIVRLFHPESASGAVKGKAEFDVGGLNLEAAEEGLWGKSLRASLNQDVSEEVATRLGLAKADLFNLTVKEVAADGTAVRTESFLNVSVKESARRIDRVVKDDSQLVRWRGAFPAQNTLPSVTEGDDPVTAAEIEFAEAKKELEAAKKATPPVPANISAAETKVTKATADVNAAKDAIKGSDGLKPDQGDFNGSGKETAKAGLFALEKADLFNLLCIPPYKDDGNVDSTLVGAAAAYCEKKRAMLLVDPLAAWDTVAEVIAGLPNIGTTSKNAALFFPRLRQPNPLHDNKLEDYVPCGAVAGIFARTDAQRGVWKAPAGLDATLVGVPQLTVPLTNDENGQLNPLGVNCLRSMPAAGRVVWGSRTLQGNDRLASEWKYVPVRRTALFLEESLYRALQWVVFEPNDEPLWAQIRLNVGAFMNSLFRQGAFQGTTPREAYFVKCDKETTTQNDIDRGIVNILVGFAPLKPAEFVVIKLQQIAGQLQT
ncbi:MAG: phage tail sheath C-terminal domain-containing protein [Acidobacteriota bacterium]